MTGRSYLPSCSLAALIALAAFSAARGEEPSKKASLSAEEKAEGFVALFDGESLDGWEGRLDTFRVEDGAIVGGNLKNQIPRNEFLCTKQEFGDFELRLQANLVGAGQNAGIQFRSQRIPDHHEVIGYQCDMGMAGERNIWGALYDESRRRRFLVEPPQALLKRAYKPDAWNAFTIRCEGPRIQIWLNDVQTVDYQEPDPDVAPRGIIGLQIHGGPPSEAWYKDIRIRTLQP